MRESAGCGRRVLERGGDYTGFEGTRSHSFLALRKSRKPLPDRVPRRPCRPFHEQERAPLFLGQGGIVSGASGRTGQMSPSSMALKRSDHLHGELSVVRWSGTTAISSPGHSTAAPLTAPLGLSAARDAPVGDGGSRVSRCRTGASSPESRQVVCSNMVCSQGHGGGSRPVRLTPAELGADPQAAISDRSRPRLEPDPVSVHPVISITRSRSQVRRRGFAAESRGASRGGTGNSCAFHRRRPERGHWPGSGSPPGRASGIRHAGLASRELSPHG